MGREEEVTSCPPWLALLGWSIRSDAVERQSRALCTLIALVRARKMLPRGGGGGGFIGLASRGEGRGVCSLRHVARLPDLLKERTDGRSVLCVCVARTDI